MPIKIEYSLQTYPLTSPQREIWFDQMLHDGVPLYNIGGYVKIPCPINPVLFEQAVNLLVQKHDTLRTMLTEVQDEDGVPMQTYVEPLTVTKMTENFGKVCNLLIFSQTYFCQSLKILKAKKFSEVFRKKLT
jgi:hypothetical protein